MTTMIEDHQLEQVVADFDDYVAQVLLQHQDAGLSALALSSVFLARLVLLNQYAKSDSEFRSLLAQVAAMDGDPSAKLAVH